MLISNITFFLKCVENLKKEYKHATDINKKNLLTFLKTWIWYNSVSEKIFFTGNRTLESIIKNEKVKEHWYSNLTTVKYLMQDDKINGKERLSETTKRELILWVYTRMCWNYTTIKENNDLIKEQEYDIFKKYHQGDPFKAYKKALIGNYPNGKIFSSDIKYVKSSDQSRKILKWLDTNKEPNVVILEILFNIDSFDDSRIDSTKKIQKKLIDLVKENEQIKMCEVGNFTKKSIKNYSINLEFKSMAELLRELMEIIIPLYTFKDLKNNFDSKNEVNAGFFRKNNNFSIKERAMSISDKNNKPVYISDYNNTSSKIKYLNLLYQFNSVNLIFYNYNLDLIVENKSK